VITDDELRRAAASIDEAPDAVIQRRLARFKETCDARSDREVLRQQADMDVYLEAHDKDLADYERAERAYVNGDMALAAEWYRKAADNDFADSALRLAMVLDALAEKYLTMPGRTTTGPDEDNLVIEASHWYLTAYMAGDIERDDAVELIERLITRHDPTTASTRPVLVVATSAADSDSDHEAGDTGHSPVNERASESLSLVRTDQESSHQKPELTPLPDPPRSR
jgi:hypothetical protein